jgi:poly-gamma-glutamate synthesis protein (capsule biosynthesis protein)
MSKTPHSFWARGWLVAAAASFLLLAGCNFPFAAAPVDAGDSAPTETPFQPGDDSSLDVGFGKDNPPSWWLSPNLPAGVIEHLALPENIAVVEDAGEAQLSVVVNSGQTIGQWVYALAAPFPTITDEASLEDVQALWRGEGERQLLVSPETEAVFSAWWGAPGVVQVLAAEELLDAAWAQDAWALLPFEQLQPRWKVLLVDGVSPVRVDFDAASYALSVPIGLSGEDSLVNQVLAEWGLADVSNRDTDLMTTVAVTGVTALVRATAYEMNRSGITYPAEDVGPLLAGADITHISNEVPFWDECPPPDPVQRGLVFCSDPDYIQLLEAIGTDVVELTGDHFNDHGQEPMLFSLDIYDQYGIPYYGGGHNLEEGRSAVTFEHNGNRIAFIGCNGKSGYATASETQAGAVQCDYEWLASEVGRLSDEGYLVIATFQHNEVYSFVPQPGLIRDFAVPAEAGASIVSGSQAHQAHGMGFTDDDTLVTYGLGNMFFDQWTVVDNGEKALIAMHVFYGGRYISTELYTIQFIDFAKPRFMTAEERADFLNALFSASLWND